MQEFYDKGYTEETVFKLKENVSYFIKGQLVVLDVESSDDDFLWFKCPITGRPSSATFNQIEYHDGPKKEELTLPGVSLENFTYCSDGLYGNLTYMDVFKDGDANFIWLTLNRQSVDGRPSKYLDCLTFTPEQAMEFALDLGSFAAKMISEKQKVENANG